jgi:prepilin-type N-terminal cleavage/methylation domain-containing protein
MKARTRNAVGRGGAAGRARRRSGMTLIEVMIAIALLAVGVAGMIAIQVLAMRDEAIAREDNEASRIVRDVLEQVQRMPFASVPATGGYEDPAWIANAGYDPGEVAVKVQTPAGGEIDQLLYQVSWRVTAVAGQASLRNVDVQVAWTDAADRAQTYTASTLKYNP